MSDTEFERRLESVRSRVARAAGRAGRGPGDVSILPVTKGFPPSVLRRVLDAGFEALGENRVGEAEEKKHALGDGAADASWHMIGHLQRNKAEGAVALFDRIDSVDSMRLARKLSAMADKTDRPNLPILVQVNASGEASKGGFPVDEAPSAVEEILELPRLRIEGLMTMAPLGASEATLRDVFARTRRCLEACRHGTGSVGAELSMGMSGDFEIAVEEGATQVRLGTALLGERPD